MKAVRSATPEERGEILAMLIKAEGLEDNPMALVKRFRELRGAAIAVFPEYDVAPWIGSSPLYVVMWSDTLRCDVFVTGEGGELMKAA